MYYTRISRKQIGVIFSNFKKGNLNLTDEIIKWLYNSIADFGGFQNNADREDVQCRIKSALDDVFSGEYKEAEKEIVCAYELYNAIYA